MKFLLLLSMIITTNSYGQEICLSDNLIENGDFETPKLNKSWNIFDSIPSWDVRWKSRKACGRTYVSPKVEYQKIYQEIANDDNQYVELDSDCGISSKRSRTGTILKQTINNIKPNTNYIFSFDYKARTLNKGKMGVLAKIANKRIKLKNVTNLQWETFNKTVKFKNKHIDSNGNIKLTFKDLGVQNTFGVFIDNGAFDGKIR